jgi:sulfite reductase (NADPH) flavoprotein alpha-component
VGLLTFADEIDSKAVERQGVCSHFLVSNPAEDLEPFPVEVVRPTRFRLPKQRARPIVMYAGGTGLSPFRAFIQQRLGDAHAEETWLLLAVRDETAIPCFAELQEAAAGGIQVRIVLSRADRRWQNSPDNLQGDWVAAKRGYIDRLLLDEKEATALQRLLVLDGATFYICGRTTFAHTVHAMLQKLFSRSASETSGDQEHSKRLFQQLVADQRLQQDIFTTFAPSCGPGVLGDVPYDASDIALHNQVGSQALMVIRGAVYDMTEFLELHPGGAQIIYANLGLDATRAYERAEHHLNAEVHAMTDLYKVGQVRRLDFGDHWGVVLSPKGVHTVHLESLFRYWIRALYEIVELENTWNNNLGLRNVALTEAHCGPSALQDSLLLEDHHKLTLQLDQIIDGSLQYLWAITVGLCDPQQPYDALIRDINDLWRSPDGIMARGVTVDCLAMFERVRTNPSYAAELSQLLNCIVEADSKALREIKQVLCDGVRLFEVHQEKVLRNAGIELVQILRRLPAMLARFKRRLSNTLL